MTWTAQRPRPRGPAQGPALAHCIVLAPVLAALVGCREGSAPAAVFFPLQPSTEGAAGCNGSDITFAGLALVTPSGTPPTLLATSQVTAAQGTSTLFVGGEDGAGLPMVFELDFSAGNPLTPVSTPVLPGAWPRATAVLSGIAVLDPGRLLVMDHESNSIWLVHRFSTAGGAQIYAGIIQTAGAFGDGVGSQVAFDFGAPSQIVTTGDGIVLLADSGNDAVRLIQPDFIPTVSTLFGGPNGGSVPGSASTPRGLSVNCLGELLLAHAVGIDALLQGFPLGSVTTVETALTMPVSLVTTLGGELYWVAAGTGDLRSRDAAGAVDMPLGAGSFAGSASLALLEVGGANQLFALDADAVPPTLRVTP